jgi:hypothetical protein
MEFQGELSRHATAFPKGVDTTPDPEAVTIGQLLTALKPAQLWGIVATVVTALAALFSAAFALGSLTGQR